MRILERCKIFLSSSYFVPFFCSFLLWCFVFGGFLSGHLALVEDAQSYLDQAKYLTDAFLKGVFPVWSSESFGMPSDFFHLRLGAFNPFYIVVTLLRAIGLPFLFSYLWSLAAYYFLGCCAFYLICKRVTGHTLASFSGFLLLYFSSLGTRIFDSFIILVFVPLMWFFFFVIAFFQSPSKKNFLGIIFSCMLLLSTYIPFYFVTIFFVIALFFILVFPDYLLNMCQKFWMFITKNRMVTLFGVFAVLIALLSGIIFFQASKAGDYVMPRRHYQVEGDVAVEVHIDTTSKWSIFEDIAFSSDFTDFRRMKFAVLYIPVFAWLILCCGIIVPFSRRMLFYFAVISFFIILGAPGHFSLYEFVHQHVPFFRYFRNLHFFLWWLILPAFILLATNQLKKIFEMKDKAGRFWFMAFVGIVHILWLIVTLMQEDRIWPSVVSVFLSGIFFAFYFQGKLDRRNSWISGLLILFVISAQPLGVYYYLSKNASVKNELYVYEKSGEGFEYSRNQELVPSGKITNAFYIALKDVQVLASNIDWSVFNQYVNSKFIVYDRVQISKEPLDWKDIEQALRYDENRVFVESWNESRKFSGSQPGALRIRGPGEGVDVIRSGPNGVTVKTDFQDAKFLVFVDVFHADWQCRLDGVPVKIYKANTAFKGVYIPEGKHTVEFFYNKFLGLRYAGLIFFSGVFLALLWFSFRGHE